MASRQDELPLDMLQLFAGCPLLGPPAVALERREIVSCVIVHKAASIFCRPLLCLLRARFFLLGTRVCTHSFLCRRQVAGNYAADMLPNMLAKKAGYPIGLYLDAKTNTLVEVSSLFVVGADSRRYSPKST